MLSLCGLSRVRFGSCRKQTGCLDIYGLYSVILAIAYILLVLPLLLGSI